MADSVNPSEDSGMDPKLPQGGLREREISTVLSHRTVSDPSLNFRLRFAWMSDDLYCYSTYFHNLVEVESSAGDWSCNLCAHFPW